MMAMMAGDKGIHWQQNKTSKLRKALLQSGDEIGHVFSSVQWNLEETTASFWMCDSVFEKYKDYGFTLIRTDSWYCLGHDDVKLGNATRNLT